MKCILLLLCIIIGIHAQSAYSAAAQQQILQYHNKLRRNVAKGTFMSMNYKLSPAANMRELTWSWDLANAAQKQANSCPPHSFDDPPYQGENYMGFHGWNGVDISGIHAQQGWETGFSRYEWPGYFTTCMYSWSRQGARMLWAKTRQVGCGVKVCGTVTVIICRYDNQEGFKTEPVYQRGATCSSCPAGTRCNDGLCA